MKVAINDIPVEGLELNFSGNEDILSDAVHLVPEQKDLIIDPHVKGKLRVLKTDNDVYVTGTVYGKVRLICSRCLESYELLEELDINVLLKPKSMAEQQPDREEEGESTFFIDGQEFDPGEIILQELFLEIPMKPLCNGDCPGLCPKCGKLMQPGHCDCSEEEKDDPRWAKIKRLRDKLSDHNDS